MDAPNSLNVESSWVLKIRYENKYQSYYLYVAYGTKGLVIYNIDDVNYPKIVG